MGRVRAVASVTVTGPRFVTTDTVTGPPCAPIRAAVGIAGPIGDVVAIEGPQAAAEEAPSGGHAAARGECRATDIEANF